MSFAVLFVCTGNICRSPLAERLFRARVPEGVLVVAGSAGTHGLTGRAIDEPSAALLREMGVDPDGHEARRLTPGIAESADLVLTASVEHRSAVVQAAPTLFRRVFTLREFARLGAGLGPLQPPVDRAALVQRVRDVAAQRGIVDVPTGEQSDDIIDPFGAPQLARTSAGAVSDAVDGVLAALGLSKNGSATPLA